MLHKLKTVNPNSLLMFSTSLVALLIMSPLPFICIHSGSWISKWSKSFWRRFTSTFLPIPKTICLENNLINPIQVAKNINNKDLEITNSEEKLVCKLSIIFFLSKGSFLETSVTCLAATRQLIGQPHRDPLGSPWGPIEPERSHRRHLTRTIFQDLSWICQSPTCSTCVDVV